MLLLVTNDVCWQWENIWNMSIQSKYNVCLSNSIVLARYQPIKREDKFCHAIAREVIPGVVALSALLDVIIGIGVI